MSTKPYPSFDVYPGDFYRSVASTCTIGAQGLWWRLRILMHDSERCGYLQRCGKPMEMATIARCTGLSIDQAQALFGELDDAGALNWEGKFVKDDEIFRQNIARAEARDRKNKSRNSYKQLKTQENGHSALGELVTQENDDLVQKGERRKEKVERSHGEGEGEKSTVFEGDARGNITEPSHMPVTEEEKFAYGLAPAAPALGPPEYAAAVAVERATSPPEPSNWRHTDAIVNEIILATPTAKALRWSLITVQNMPILRGPVVEAIRAEAAERGEGTQEAARHMLGLIREITGYVEREAGWEKFWPKSRFDRFFKHFEYRNPVVFNRAGGANGAGNAKGKTAGNAEVLRRVLQGAGGGISDDESHSNRGGDAGQARPGAQLPTERHHPRGVSGGSRGTGRGGAGDGVRSGASGTEDVSKPRTASRALWPSGA